MKTKTNRDLLTKIQAKILDLIVKKYVESRDFNGFPASYFVLGQKLSDDAVRSLISSLIKNGSVSLTFSGNPHIKAFSEMPTKDEQEVALINCPLQEMCLYPSPRTLKRKVKLTKYHEHPYTKALMLGCGQLDSLFFKLEVLERYLRNPLYEVWNDGTSGNIATKSEVFKTGQFEKEDEVYLDFGFGYSNDADKHRLVVAFPRYLHNLSSTHQLHWYSNRTALGVIDSDYRARSYAGEFTENVSIYEAILMQMREVNAICDMIGEPHLFKRTFDDGVSDPNYGPMKRPTLREFRESALTLRIIALDNMDENFFRNRLNVNEEGHDENNRKLTKMKSMTRLLEEWFVAIRYRPASAEVIPSIVKPLKILSKIRGSAAHTIYNDEHGANWLEEHRKLITSIYHSLDGLRLVLSTHPKAKGQYKSPEILEQLKIKY